MAGTGTGDGDGRERLALASHALVALTFGLIVLGALVRAHRAGLACPDWPLCFGELVPRFDFRIALEWGHRLIAGVVALLFTALAVAILRRPDTRGPARRLVTLGAALLAAQIVLGGLTVLRLLASWTVTAHLLTGNAFAVTLLLLGAELREAGGRRRARAGLQGGERPAVAVAALLLVVQMMLGGLVSSQYAGLACPDWPACANGVLFPTLSGVVGLHLAHRWTAVALLIALGVAAFVTRRRAGLGRLCTGALGLGVLQLVVGVVNVRAGVPVEVTGLHSALAAALVLVLALAVRETVLEPRRARRSAPAGALTNARP